MTPFLLADIATFCSTETRERSVKIRRLNIGQDFTNSAREIRQSVALVTRNRPTSLERTLKSLRLQDVQPWEVVISDDSTEEYAPQVAAIVENFGYHYVRGPQRGLYANRNHVAGRCAGTHVRTMDDDHEFPAGHFAACAAALEKDSESVWIIGEHYPTTANRDVPPACPGQLHPRGFSVGPPDPDNCWAISDGATIFPRALFDRGLRYVEAFRFGAVYLEFGSRLYWLGYRIRHLNTTHVFHHYDPSARSFHEPEEELAAQFFAMMSHSWRYQATLRNKILTGLEIGRKTLRHGRMARAAARTARMQFDLHMRSLDPQD